MLRFRRVTGEQVEAEVRVDDEELAAAHYLTARRVWLDDGTELRQHRAARTSQRSTGYDRLDNEILAGRRLYDVSESSGHPTEVAGLYGDEATSADSFALLEPYRGDPLREAVEHLLDDDAEAFQASLLTGLCWLAAAGIAHRALSPDTVRWDSHRRQVQITDFSLSTVFGAPREAVAGSPSWVAREQRPGSARGLVSDRDDIWAAGRLIFFAFNQGEELARRDQLADSGLAGPLEGVFGPPEDRPTAAELLGRMGGAVPVADGAAESTWLREARQQFWEVRQRKHPGAAVPPEAGQGAGQRGVPMPRCTRPLLTAGLRRAPAPCRRTERRRPAPVAGGGAAPASPLVAR